MNKDTPKHTKLKKPKRVGVALVLGAGGLKSAAHIGLLEIFEKNHIPIDLIVASGSASVVAAMYSYYKSSRIVMDKLISSSLKDFIDISWFNYLRLFWSSKGLSEGKNFHKMLMHQLPQGDISDMKIPLVIMATELDTFNEVEFSSGELIPIVMASAATPPFFSPVEYDGKFYLDGGISSPLPADVAKKYNPKLIIASNILNHDTQYSPQTMLQITYRSLQISNFHLAIFQSYDADILINMGIHSSEQVHSEIQNIYQTGKRKALSMLPNIRSALNSHGISSNPIKTTRSKARVRNGT